MIGHTQVRPGAWLPVQADWRSSALELAVATMFVGVVTLQWRGLGYLPGTDAIAYIVGGINLVGTGAFTNAAGQPEIWFPPVYPLLIGGASLGGRLDPAMVVPALAGTMAVVGLVLVGLIVRELGGRRYEPALAMALVGLNPIYQSTVVYGLSESTATALVLTAFLAWLRLSDQSRLWRYAFVGVLVGLGYLTRPESLLLLPCWALVDVIRSRGRRGVVRRYAAAAGATLLVALPYVIYLYDHTGQVTLTGKTAINLTSGRSTYSGLPTQFIDPATLEIGLYPYEVTVREEIRRVAWNAARIAGIYLRSLMAVLALPILLGLLSFIETRWVRFLWGGMAFVAYLGIVVIFQVKPRFLHMSLPFLSILAARGVFRLLDSARSELRARWPVRPGLLVVAAIGAGVILQSAAAARADVANRRAFSLLRDAGVQLGRLAPGPGVVYDQWGQVAYHAGHTSWILTPNDVHTILAYVDKHAPAGRPIYLALSSMEAHWYHPTVRALLQASAEFPELHRELELADSRGRVVVYRMVP